MIVLIESISFQELETIIYTYLLLMTDDFEIVSDNNFTIPLIFILMFLWHVGELRHLPKPCISYEDVCSIFMYRPLSHYSNMILSKQKRQRNEKLNTKTIRKQHFITENLLN